MFFSFLVSSDFSRFSLETHPVVRQAMRFAMASFLKHLGLVATMHAFLQELTQRDLEVDESELIEITPEQVCRNFPVPS